MKLKNVVFAPNWRESNPYQNLLKQSLEANGCSVELKNYPEGFFPFNKLLNRAENPDILHIHWISEILMRIVWSKNPLFFRMKLFLFWLDCKLVKLRGVKLIWTIHNKFAHESQNKREELIVRKLFCQSANKIILHSHEALEEICKVYQVDIRSKTEVIFHGNYHGCYPLPSLTKDELRDKYNNNIDDTILLYFGSIKPYKGVENLIRAFNKANVSHVKLFICGAPSSSQHEQELVSLIGNNANIHSNFNFLTDQELIDFITLSDAIVLPYSDTLTSGSVLLAMTLGKGVILPDTAKVFGCIPTAGSTYFSNEQQLINIIEQSKLAELQEQGRVNFIKAENMNWDIVSKLTFKAYTS